MTMPLDHDLPLPSAPMKLVVSGPVGAGKTTFVQALSETPVIATEAEASEDIGKTHTTVAFDYGTLNLGGQEIYLYGTPGQDRFNFMWEVLCEGALGLCLLVAGNAPQDFQNARNILEFITSRIAVPFVIGVTRQDLDHVWAPEDVAAYFQVPDDQVLGLNATDPDCNRRLLERLLERSIAQNETQPTPDAAHVNVPAAYD